MFKRLQICIADGVHPPRKLVWFRARKNHQLLWSPYGMREDSEHALLRAEWPEELVPLNDKSERRYPLRGYLDRSIVIDHFNWHQDGTVLLKDAGASPVYSHKMKLLKPLGVASPLFLEMHMQTEGAEAYRPTAAAANCTTSIVVTPHQGVALYFAFAGRDFDMTGYLVEVARTGWSIGPTLHLGSFVGGLLHKATDPRNTLGDDRLQGTLVSLRFMLESGRYNHKTFLFQ
jgi:hypothetical protein